MAIDSWLDAIKSIEDILLTFYKCKIKKNEKIKANKS